MYCWSFTFINFPKSLIFNAYSRYVQLQQLTLSHWLHWKKLHFSPRYSLTDNSRSTKVGASVKKCLFVGQRFFFVATIDDLLFCLCSLNFNDTGDSQGVSGRVRFKSGCKRSNVHSGPASRRTVFTVWRPHYAHETPARLSSFISSPSLGNSSRTNCELANVCARLAAHFPR